MNGSTIRVGVVGASAARGWAAATHLPALAQLDEYEVSAVATTQAESARAAADAFGARHAFASGVDLAEHPDVDLVVAAVRTAGKTEVIRAALAAGKHVLSEWPLTVDAAEAAELAAAADAAGVVHAVSLQAYHSPGARFVADAVGKGAVGAVESISFVGGGDPLGGSRIPQSLAWSTVPDAGTGILMIMGGHTLAALDAVAGGPAGEISDVAAVAANRHQTVTVAETGAPVDNRIAGQVAFVGRFAGGAVASVSLHGGNAPGPDGFLLTIAGTEGTITATAAQPGHYAGWADWRVRIAPANGTAEEVVVPAGPAHNIAAVYGEIAQAISDGRPARPDFHTAARHHRVLDAVERAARTGRHERVDAAVAA
jgi:predicted dehydrogenase